MDGTVLTLCGRSPYPRFTPSKQNLFFSFCPTPGQCRSALQPRARPVLGRRLQADAQHPLSRRKPIPPARLASEQHRAQPRQLEARAPRRRADRRGGRFRRLRDGRHRLAHGEADTRTVRSRLACGRFEPPGVPRDEGLQVSTAREEAEDRAHLMVLVGSKLSSHAVADWHTQL